MIQDPLPGFETLGNKVTEFKKLETFPTPPGIHQVEMISDEVTAVCPVTGQPDWYVVSITYSPQKRCVESKSLKLYLQNFRNTGHFCEKFAQIICDDLYEVLKPRRIQVQVKQKSRGGISIISCANKETRP